MHHRALVILASAAFALAASTVALSASPARADTEDFTFSSFDADYYLSRADDGSSRLRTVETLVAEFPDFDQNKGIVRAIPLSFEGADLGVSVESVTDAAGRAVPFEESSDDGFREVAIGTNEYVRGEQTYVITYDQRNVVRAYDDTASDEFYWDTNGTGWDQPFGSVTGRVHVPDDLVTELTGSSACYVGGEGSTDTCAVDEATATEGSIFTVSADDIRAEQNVTIAIGFERGTFAEPTRTRDEPWVVVLPAVLAVFGIAFSAIAGVLRRTRWRDARGRGTIVAQYERPKGSDLLECGDLIGRTSSAMSAELMDLAVRGNLRIIDRTPAGEQKDREFSLGFVTFDGLTEAERKVMRAVFGRDPEPGYRRKIGASVEIGRRLDVQARNAPQRVLDRGWKRAVPKRVRAVVVSSAVALGVLGVLAFILLAFVDGLTVVGSLLIGAVIVLAVVAAAAASKQSTVTEEGALVRDHLEGMRIYIQLAEADRLRMLQSPEGAERRPVDTSDPDQVVRVYEELLPFAILFRIEKEWSEELDRLYASNGSSPDWYTGARPFDSGAFTGFVVASHAQTSSSTWSSSAGGSSFGGSSGGGFSGGGGGGGGGGGR